MPADSPDQPDATVIAPAFNEERALPVVLAALAAIGDPRLEVIVVDDGSTDRTAEVARAHGVRVIRLAVNSGKAAAVRAGIAAARGDKIVVTDADGTYPADAIPKIVRLLDAHDVVIGVRTTGRGNIPPLNRFGNAAIRAVVHWFSGFRSADPLTGLYGLRRGHLETMALESEGFGLEVEIGVKAARMGLSWVDHPIAYGRRIGESKLNPVKDGLVIASTLVRTLFRRPRLRPLPGRGDVAAAPLAVVATIASVILLTIAAVSLVTTSGLALAAIAQPTIPLTLSPARAGLVTLMAGLVLWRITTHWGRPPPGTLAVLVPGSVVGGAGLVLAATLGALSLGLVPPGSQSGLSAAGLALTSGVVAAAALVALGARLLVVPRGAPPGSAATPQLSRVGLAGPAEVLLVGGALVLLGIAAGRFISLGQVLGFDEAVYAATARSWILDTPNSAWVAHRSPGISLLGLPFALPEWDAGLRLVGLAFGLVSVVAAWALARRLRGPSAGVLAALLVAVVPALQLNAGLFLTDVPSAAAYLVLALVLWRELGERPRPGLGLLWVAPLVAVTFYLRYGASVPLLLLAATAMVLWPRGVMASWRTVIATAGLLLLLLMPHLVQSTVLLGHPLAIALSAREGAAPAYPGEGLVYYWKTLSTELAGPVAGWVVVLGAVAWPIRLWLRRGLAATDARAHTFLVLPALGQLLVLGLVALPQARYVILPVILLLIAGAATLVDVGTQLSPAWRRSLALGLVVAVVVSGIGSAAVMIRLQAEHTPVALPLADAARLIREDAAGAECSILAYPPPEYVWYTGCDTYHFAYPPVPDRERALTGERRYLVLSSAENDREPAGALRARYLRLAEAEPMAVVPSRVTGEPAIEIYRLRVSE